MSKMLVTGGGGQLGRAFRKAFPEAVVLERTDLDVTDRQAVLRRVTAERPDIIVNAAAFTKVDAAEADPDGAYRVNVEGAEYVAQAAEAVGAMLVQVSTDYVYPGNKAGPYSEKDETGPLSVYGKTKLAGESAAQKCSRTLVVRTSWVFGDGHNFIRSILKAVRKGASELTVVSDQKGLPTFAPHLAEGILGLVEKGATGIYHLAGSGPPVTWAALAEQAIASQPEARLTGFSSSPGGPDTRVKPITTAEYAASRSGPVAPRPRNSVLDCSKAAALGVTLPPWKAAVALYSRQSSPG